MIPVLFLMLLASDASLNGRWNIKVTGEPRNRAWWLEVSGVGGTGPLKGRFVGFPGGDMNDIGDLAVRGGELTFSFTRDGQSRVYKARLEGDTLAGVMTSGADTLRFTGRRAPVLSDKDDGVWKAGVPVALFNGRDLSGWQPLVAGKPLGWTVKNGLLANLAGANNLVSEKKFFNFALRAEYRIVEGSNSGIGLRGRYEVQILDDYGKPPNRHGHGALYSRIVPSVNASRHFGEWQTMEVRLVGREVTVTLNGKKVIDHREVEGLTAMAHDADEAEPGPIVLQGDHKEVEFRSVVVTPLVKR